MFSLYVQRLLRYKNNKCRMLGILREERGGTKQIFETPSIHMRLSPSKRGGGRQLQPPVPSPPFYLLHWIRRWGKRLTTRVSVRLP